MLLNFKHKKHNAVIISVEMYLTLLTSATQLSFAPNTKNRAKGSHVSSDDKIYNAVMMAFSN
jgi:hypothetical protein